MSSSMSSKHSLESKNSPQKVRVAIIGAGISGLALANGLLNDVTGRFDVHVYERDTIAFDLERGGYQIRMAAGGIDSLKEVTDVEAWQKLQKVWGKDDGKAPAIVDPKSLQTLLKLAEVKIYPQSCSVARLDLKKVLLDKVQKCDAVKFGCAFERYEIVSSRETKGEHEVVVHFQDPVKNPSIIVDILIAADGSNSRINRQAGINNKQKMGEWALIQSRGTISTETYNRLPSSVTSQGSCMFLAGAKYSGFAAVYRQSNLDDDGSTGDSNAQQIFWSALVPKEIGDAMIKEAGDNKMVLIQKLSDYVTNTLHFDPSGLPFIYKSAVESVRTGAVTTSVKPTQDWRNGQAEQARIILLGDAIHPMTPGRGMGANQALMDAGKLVKLIKKTKFSIENAPSDNELQSLVRTFDAEMYDRAFKMVKASEDMSGLDTTTRGGHIKIAIGKTVLGLIGFVASILSVFGLFKFEKLTFDHPDLKS